ncbi:protein CONSERVED IN THE GREEN LINEAGE AND DIATOMS 27, chloroplastic-like isoform X2 [Glycine soja]|uniref:protein CONSERVED IN THE GREEN LINEAGE AND DIATOMS 27, chloroplastic-like isoform X2 n=1 Tax=Glycine soja TaxID=3848 RepID=UPI0003DE7C98|nr:protein CONSERVED IN THE GREEN LINEAGE AND DIATOMS 27, chloroplastic-like isoform X2 [Glycine soja]|eukprot:XP_006590639.1 protein CONSERVED IN THE GREEN LINEAGE AND DIATOMS 27, chloroplastic isoform X2 [Glycine max]
MIRQNVYCSLIPSARQARPGNSYGSLIIHNHKASKFSHRISIKAKAIKDEMDGETSGSSGRSWDPGLEIEVPFEQRPVNEYSSLKDGILYSWGELGPGSFFLRLGSLWLAVFTVLGGPIAAASFNPSKGWSYVGDRLLSAVIPYEESGWYDGQMWVKPPEILARDRLLGSYKVKPVVKLLKQTLVGTGALLVTGVMLFIFATPVENFFRTTFTKEEIKSTVQAPKVNTKLLRKEELLKLPVEVITDDDLAAAAAEAADGRPVYCRDRYYRALAGGQYCKWEDLLK